MGGINLSMYVYFSYKLFLYKPMINEIFLKMFSSRHIRRGEVVLTSIII